VYVFNYGIVYQKRTNRVKDEVDESWTMMCLGGLWMWWKSCSGPV